MDLWIETARPDLDALLVYASNRLILNDGEDAGNDEGDQPHQGRASHSEDRARDVAIKKGEHGALLFGEGDQFFSCGAYQLKTFTIRPGQGTRCRRHGWISRRHCEEGALQRSAQSDDLRKRAGQFLRGSVSSLERLRKLSMEIEKRCDIQIDEPIRGAGLISRDPDGENPNESSCQSPLAAALLGLDLAAFGRIFQFFIMFIIALYDFIYALPELCSVVSHEIGGLQRLGFFLRCIVRFRIGIRGNSFLLTSR